MKIQTPKGTAELKEAVCEITIPGLTREYTFVQLTDLHIMCHEPGDPEDAVALAESRSKFWAWQAGFFADGIDSEETRIYPVEACELVAEHIRGMENIDGVFFTGDTVDFPSVANFRRAKKLLDSLDKRCIIVPGNHDAIPEDAPEDMKSAFSDLMGNLPEYFAEEFDGFDVLGFSDGSIKITDSQVEFLKERLALGKPVVILLHAPIFTEITREKVYPYWGYNWMVGDPGQPDERQTEAGFLFRDLICEHRNLVKAVLAGHVHMWTGDDAPPVKNEVLQYTTKPAFEGCYRKIIIRG